MKNAAAEIQLYAQLQKALPISFSETSDKVVRKAKVGRRAKQNANTPAQPKDDGLDAATFSVPVLQTVIDAPACEESQLVGDTTEAGHVPDDAVHENRGAEAARPRSRSPTRKDTPKVGKSSIIPDRERAEWVIPQNCGVKTRWAKEGVTWWFVRTGQFSKCKGCGQEISGKTFKLVSDTARPEESLLPGDDRIRITMVSSLQRRASLLPSKCYVLEKYQNASRL